ncbi:ring-cleaving dioxygenase [Puia dinghuensis]|uniref:Diguanylate cyclase n=1 Tax=Puia dinghuensis TaxID=1792502 RepID=A0A8J2UCF6_9BACT|nr:ring-cleaving dioxygenase [Puia dinghuensis]GGA98676.1 diguanylate cyclase [Puia dinghuensis]
MNNTIKGIHHITAIAGDAQRNYDFYTKTLGLRMVKRTVNFDDPGTYHFYYGNETGTPGTILTFFPWEGIVGGRTGTGMATEIGYSVPTDSLAFWADRFKQHNIQQGPVAQRFGETYLPFQDPDGLNIDFIASKYGDDRQPWTTAEVTAAAATKGFHSVTLTLKTIRPTAEILTDIFGFELKEQEGDRYRFISPLSTTASIVDLVEAPKGNRGLNGGGTNHHVAFRVPNEEVQMEFREKILSRGLHITPKINRDYFYSLYFREPGGVLFELATDNPGFTVDEPLDQLGTHLKLPVQYESSRENIEKSLPTLHN